ncbi:MAG TPA: NAD(P)/FAD-dependent oxidoreductase [Rectinemataceae bacterium]|nr:NAD(P)/FAD-dependent oxidoreductase [Rectinemataceae bacterium]
MISPQTYKAIILGAGPAGLFAAIRLAEANPEERPGSGILILERREKPARKLLLSGSGQCNLTHAGEIADFLGHYGGGAKAESAARFLKPALYAFTNEELLAWFRARGIEFETEDSGKIFPADRRATSILKILQDEAYRLGVRVIANSRASAISARAPDGFLVRVETRAPDASRIPDASGASNIPEAPDAAEYAAPLVLIATGGLSYPKTGSSGDGYALAASLGHRIVPPRPALAPVFIRNFALNPLAGLSFRDAGLAILRDGKRAFLAEGDLLITHGGLSGPLILDSSRHIAPGDSLEINFVDVTIEEFRNRLDAELKSNPRRLVRTALADLGLTKNMAELFCDLAGIAKEETAAALPRAKRETLCRFACAHLFEVTRLGSLEVAMVTAGGVDLAEVNPGTMESRLIPGLFFAGEVLDIDGDSGGYNLQAAFSTGSLAAKGMSISKAGSDPNF